VHQLPVNIPGKSLLSASTNGCQQTAGVAGAALAAPLEGTYTKEFQLHVNTCTASTGFMTFSSEADEGRLTSVHESG
jgi:hypothetical protein